MTSSAEEEAGLIVLLRTGTSIASDLPESFIRALDREAEPYAAFEALVAHNVRLVHNIVLTHLHRGLDHEDLFQHGVMGLIRAIRKFDVTRGYKLSTYATWWIRQSLSHAIADEGSLIRMPVHVHEELNRIRKLMRERDLEGRESASLEISLALGISRDKVDFYLRTSQALLSLDVVYDDDAHLLDFVDTTTIAHLPTPEEFMAEWTSVQWVREQLAELTDREASIVSQRIGLTSGEPMTLDAIGSQLGVTRERIRQIEMKALNKLRVKNGIPEQGPSGRRVSRGKHG